ncbi:MAG TPA: CinA family protein [Flavobacteriaceae bacterium]|nr:CinA family protein [Flavobacteriaceae bacterium]
MPSKTVLECSKALAKKGYNIAFVESATAGRMCAEFSLAPESGAILRGGISCYEVFVKENILKVPHHLIEKYTPESAEVTQSLAENGLDFFKSDVVVACTGLTMPGGSETKEKPVGTMFLHIIFLEKSFRHRSVFSGTAEEIVSQAIDAAAMLITDFLESNG